jgi:hypothetical protein
MREWGTMLTATGVIATIVSVLFALAAFYVQWRRRQNEKPEDTIQAQMERDRIGTEEQAEKPFDNAAPANEAQTGAGDSGRQDQPSMDMPFRRYTPRGSEESASQPFDDDEYVWE